MQKLIVFSLVLLISAVANSQLNDGEPCPSFTCDSATGNPGFITMGQVTEDIPDSLGRMIGVFTLNFRSLSSLCRTYCNMTETCMFWSHVKFTNNTAKCYLFKETACGVYTDENSVSTNPFESILPSTVSYATTGKLCKAEVVGDPHFTGADGSHFDFTGIPGEHYCLLSDSHIHVNAYYGGRFDHWGSNANKPLTWIRKLGIMWGHHTITLEAREGAKWQYNQGYMAKIAVDDEEVKFGQVSEYVNFLGGDVSIEWSGAKVMHQGCEIDVYEVTIRDVIRLRVILRPEISLLRTESDGVIHMNIQVSSAKLSENVHGVLGQTFRLDHQDRLPKQKLVRSMLMKLDVVPGENAKGFIDGSPKDYRSSALLKADCAKSRFTRAVALDTETAHAVEFSDTYVDGSYNRVQGFTFSS